MRFLKSIKLLIPLVAFGLFGVSVATGHVISEKMAYKRMIELNVSRIRNRMSYTQAIAEQYLQQGRIENLQKLLSSFSSEPDLLNLVVSNQQGIILVSNRLAETGKHWTTLGYKFPSDQIRNIATKHDIYTNVDDKKGYIDGLTRVCGKALVGLAQRDSCGFMLYRVDLKPHWSSIQRQQNEQSVIVAIGTGVAVLLLVLFVTFVVTSPVLEIKYAILRFAGGRQEERLHLKGKNELAELGYIVNDLFMTINTKERLLKENEQRLQTLFDTIIDAIIIIDEKGIMQAVNPATEMLFGYTQAEILGKNVNMLMDSPHHGNHDQYLKNYLTTGQKQIIGTGRDTEGQRKDGSVFPVHLSISEMNLNGKRYFTGIIQDYSERKKLENALLKANEELEERAITDGLTGLFNRSHFDNILEEELRRACRTHTPVSLLMCDIDYFKPYNDQLGHQAGDACIRQVAQLMNKLFQRAGELVARYGGEEFVAIIPGCKETRAKDTAELLRMNILHANIPHPGSDISEYVTVSIGVSTYTPGQAANKPPAADLLLQQADKALYASKQGGRNQVTQLPFSPST